MLPYLIGWNMAVWGLGSPRWLTALGIGSGLWYLALAGVVFQRKGLDGPTQVVVIAVIGIVALAGRIYRLMKQLKSKAMTAVA